MFTENLEPFLSGPPKVSLVNSFVRPFDNAVATARTCYSAKGIIDAREVAGDFESDPIKRKQKEDRRNQLASSIFKAGHHTTLQHAQFQFTLENVSRHFIWSFLHAHPYYNSEQVSQRYVEVKPGSFVIPPMNEKARQIYEIRLHEQILEYQKLNELLYTPAQNEYHRIFPARKNNSKYEKDIKKKCQEIARYVLPIGTTSFLYHSISGITLLRYWRASKTVETSLETQWVIGRMIEEMLQVDPLYEKLLEEPLDISPETDCLSLCSTTSQKFRDEFDRELGDKVSLLVDWKQKNESTLANSVREVLSLNKEQLSDEQAIEIVLNPAKNKLLGDTMNLTTLSKLSRTMVHPSWTFKKKLSHTADSQDQRHRMTPGSRPVIHFNLDETPDFITPELIKKEQHITSYYENSMEKSWNAFVLMKKHGASADVASYILPNALAVRFTESADLLNQHHKMKMRLCYNAQDEIWRASLDEVKQILDINPNIGKYLLPPCTLRLLSKTAPICPEGDRYCGVPVWRLKLEDYSRVI